MVIPHPNTLERAADGVYRLTDDTTVSAPPEMHVLVERLQEAAGGRWRADRSVAGRTARPGGLSTAQSRRRSSLECGRPAWSVARCADPVAAPAAAGAPRGTGDRPRGHLGGARRTHRR